MNKYPKVVSQNPANNTSATGRHDSCSLLIIWNCSLAHSLGHRLVILPIDIELASKYMGGGDILYSRGPQHEQRVYRRHTSSTIRVVIHLEFCKMSTEHNTIPGDRSHKTLAELRLAGHSAGPPVVTSWDLTTSQRRKCTGGGSLLPGKIPRYPPVNRRLSHVFPLQSACETTDQRVQLPRKDHS
jgi:hypothetical protein